MENVINNTEPQPSVPRGVYGRWEWDSRSMAKHITQCGTVWFLKGRWKWIAEQVKTESNKQAPLAGKPIAVIANQFKPTPKDTIKMDKAFNNLFILCGAIIAITLTLIITIN